MATIQGVYVALFGRPADPTGLAYFNGVTNNGADLTAIGDLASTDEYKERMKDLNNTQIVTKIYQSLFNRDPEAEGLNFFVDALNKGTLSINNIAIAILDGAQGSDKTIVETKIASAELFTAALDTPTEVAAYAGLDAAAAGVAFLAGVSTTAKTADEAAAAVKDIVDNSNAGVEITLNGNNNIVSPTVTPTVDNFQSSDKDDTINSTGADWDEANDTIDGGFGKDTFNLTALVDARIVAADGLKNVEVVKVQSTNAAASLDVKEAKQLTEIWNAGSTNALALVNVALSNTVGFSGTIGGATTITFASTSGTSDVANFKFDAVVSNSAITAAGIETLNISTSGGSSVGTITAGETINISGSGALKLGVGADTKTVVNTSTGAVDITLTGADKLASYTGSAAGDTVTIDTAGLTANVTIDTGAGADLIKVGAGGDSAYSITLTGGAGSDKFQFTAGTVNIDVADAANFAKSLITITDFNKAEDVIQFDAGARHALDQFELADIAGSASLFAAVEKAAGYNGAAAYDTVVFLYGGDGYVFVDRTGDNTFNAQDGLIKITGLTSLTDLTDANFLIA